MFAGDTTHLLAPSGKFYMLSRKQENNPALDSRF